MKQQPLYFQEVSVFGRVGTLQTDCSGNLLLDVVNRDQNVSEDLVHNLFTLDENQWMTGQDQGFVVRIRGCERNITGLRIQNAAQPWSTKGFKVMGALKYTGLWTNLVEEELSETNAITIFHFSQLVEVQFLRFELLSHFSQKGGGLSFFSPLAGSLH